MISHAQQGLRCQKEPGSLLETEPAISRRKQLQKVCTYHYPTTIQGRLPTYQTLRSSYSNWVQAKKNNKSKLSKLLNRLHWRLLFSIIIYYDKARQSCMQGKEKRTLLVTTNWHLWHYDSRVHAQVLSWRHCGKAARRINYRCTPIPHGSIRLQRSRSYFSRSGRSGRSQVELKYGGYKRDPPLKESLLLTMHVQSDLATRKGEVEYYYIY